MKLPHTGYRGKATEGRSTEKREQKRGKIGSVMVPRGSIFLHSVLKAEHARYTTLTLLPTKSVAELSSKATIPKKDKYFMRWKV